MPDDLSALSADELVRRANALAADAKDAFRPLPWSYAVSMTDLQKVLPELTRRLKKASGALQAIYDITSQDTCFCDDEEVEDDDYETHMDCCGRYLEHIALRGLGGVD